MQVGLDLGYSRTKVVWGKGAACDFASVTGTPDRSRFSLNGTDPGIILTFPQNVLIGDAAVIHSRHLERREDRDWIESDEYRNLIRASFSEVTAATWADLFVVTGLPIAFYDRDRATLRDVLLGEHTLQRDGRRRQTVKVTDVRVLPQGVGALLSVCLNDRGDPIAPDLVHGRIGLIDIGGKTTNVCSVIRMAEVGRETASVNAGAWDIVRAVERWLADHCPDLNLRDHEIVNAIIARQVRYEGEPVDLGDVVDREAEPLAIQILSKATQLWNGAAQLDAIFIAGGGALLLGKYITRHFERARVIDDPVYANALGYWRFAQRLGR